MDLLLNLLSQLMVLLDLVLLSLYSLLSRHFHLNLFLLNILDLLDIIFLFHFPLPPHKLRIIFQPHLHLLQPYLVLLLFFVNQMFLPFQCC
jgi:hypothetical protein